MTDLITCAAFAAMHYREDEQAIERMQQNPRIPIEEIIRRRGGLEIRAEIVRIVQIVASDDRIRELVEQQLGGQGHGGA